jgi:hypothetical protein
MSARELLCPQKLFATIRTAHAITQTPMQAPVLDFIHVCIIFLFVPTSIQFNYIYTFSGNLSDGNSSDDSISDSDESEGGHDGTDLEEEARPTKRARLEQVNQPVCEYITTSYCNSCE